MCKQPGLASNSRGYHSYDAMVASMVPLVSHAIHLESHTIRTYDYLLYCMVACGIACRNAF
jgi:hypothetical protein